MPEIAIIRRDPHTVQVGVDQATALCVQDAGQREVHALRSLDGTRTRERILSDFTADGGRAQWLNQAIDELIRCGAVINAAAEAVEISAAERARLAPDLAALSLANPGRSVTSLRRRASAVVEVRGTGRVGTGIATLLATAGVGTVRVTPIAGDAKRVVPRTVGPLGPLAGSLGRAARDAALKAAATVTFAPSSRRARATPDLIVLCPPRFLTPSAIERLSSITTPHLLVVSDGPLARIGPSVVPGITPCLRCLELHRSDRDPLWPMVLTQAAHALGGQRSATDSVLSAVAASVGTVHALSLLDDRAQLPPSAGALLEFRLPHLTWSRRVWPPHPDCGCLWQPEPLAA